MIGRVGKEMVNYSQERPRSTVIEQGPGSDAVLLNAHGCFTNCIHGHTRIGVFQPDGAFESIRYSDSCRRYPAGPAERARSETAALFGQRTRLARCLAHAATGTRAGRKVHLGT